jgi:hypothetical protein
LALSKTKSLCSLAFFFGKVQYGAVKCSKVQYGAVKKVNVNKTVHKVMQQANPSRL